MGSEFAKSYVIGYMDMVDFECELGLASGGNTVYATEAECRKNKKCIDECGLVEVKVEVTRIIQEGKL